MKYNHRSSLTTGISRILAVRYIIFHPSAMFLIIRPTPGWRKRGLEDLRLCMIEVQALVVEVQHHGMSSSMPQLGQPLTRRVSRSVR